jgi:hypothetical protein
MGRTLKYPLDAIGIGKCLRLPIEDVGNLGTLRASVHNWAKKHGLKYSVHSYGDFVEIVREPQTHRQEKWAYAIHNATRAGMCNDPEFRKRFDAFLRAEINIRLDADDDELAAAGG